MIGLRTFHELADYITINISSPNTAGLRDFHEKNSLSDLLNQLSQLKKKNKINKPLLLKISPDIKDKDLIHISELIFKYKINGVILSNTTDKNRENLADKDKNEKGGLSGLPIRDLSTQLIRKFYKW